MRLGNYPCVLVKGSKAERVYKKVKLLRGIVIVMNVNNDYRDQYRILGYSLSEHHPIIT